jgi:hypothetical protein
LELKVYLDYFWMQQSYTDERWGGSYFFKCNLPALVKKNLLDYKSLYKNVKFVTDEGGRRYVTSDSAVIYLPFCYSSFVQVYICKETLFEHFTISFECYTKKNILMKATNRIPTEKMKELGKQADQEDRYSAMDRKILTQKMERGPVMDGALRIFDSIQDVDQVRMIKLTALRKYHPKFKERCDWPCCLGVSKGGYVGLHSNKIDD